MLLLDDLLKDSEEARSETIRRSMHDWFQHVAYTRLAPGGAIVIVQTRWSADDLPGRLLREHADENWVQINMPAVCEVADDFRQVGQALWPERFSLETLKVIRSAVGGAAWDNLYRLQPSAAEGAIFQRAWWRFFREQPACRRIIQSWDTAFKSGAENDYSACTTWGVTENGYCLLWVWRDRVEFPELRKRMIWLAEQVEACSSTCGRSGVRSEPDSGIETLDISADRPDKGGHGQNIASAAISGFDRGRKGVFARISALAE